MVDLSFVRSCERNHASLSTVGGGGVVPLSSGTVVTSAIDPFSPYNWVSGVQREFDLPGATAAFRLAGRDYVHVRCSPSSRPYLARDLAELGFALEWAEVYRWSTGTGTGGRGLTALTAAEFDRFFAVWRSAWGQRHDPSGREHTFQRRFADPRSRPYQTQDGQGVLILFEAGASTQLFHFAVAAGAQGHGLGRRMLELARDVVAAGRPLWLSTGPGGQADRAAAAAGWQVSHTAASWMLRLQAP